MKPSRALARKAGGCGQKSGAGIVSVHVEVCFLVLYHDISDPVVDNFREPECIIGAVYDAHRNRISPRNKKLSDGHIAALDADASDLVARFLGEPERTIGSRSDVQWVGMGCWDRELSDMPIHGDPSDLIAVVLGEPERAIWPSRNAIGDGARCWNGKLRDATVRSNPTDLFRIVLRKPERAIRSQGNAQGKGSSGWQNILGEVSPGGDAPNLVTEFLGEPEGSAGSLRNIRRRCTKSWDEELTERSQNLPGTGTSM